MCIWVVLFIPSKMAYEFDRLVEEMPFIPRYCKKGSHFSREGLWLLAG